MRGGEVTVRLAPPSPLPAVGRSPGRHQLRLRQAGRAMSGRVILVTAVGAASGSQGRGSGACLRRLGARSSRPPDRRRRSAAAADPGRLERARASWRSGSRFTCPSCARPRAEQTCHLAVAGRCGGIRARARGAAAGARLGCRPPPAAGALPGRSARSEQSDPAASCSAPISTSDRALTALAVRELSRAACASECSSGRSPGCRPAARCSVFCRPTHRAACPLVCANPFWKAKFQRSTRATMSLDDAETDPAGAAQQQRRDDEGAGRGRGLHRHPQREAGR